MLNIVPEVTDSGEEEGRKERGKKGGKRKRGRMEVEERRMEGKGRDDKRQEREKGGKSGDRKLSISCIIKKEVKKLFTGEVICPKP